MRNANVYGTSMQGVDKWQDVADDDPSVWEAWNDQHLQPRCSIYGKLNLHDWVILGVLVLINIPCIENMGTSVVFSFGSENRQPVSDRNVSIIYINRPLEVSNFLSPFSLYIWNCLDVGYRNFMVDHLFPHWNIWAWPVSCVVPYSWARRNG